MYTLLIVYLLKGNVATTTIPGFKTETACRQAISKIQTDVMLFGVDKSFSCVKLTD